MWNDIFFSGNTENLEMMQLSYNWGLVFLSYIIAAFASYVFLDIAGRLREKQYPLKSNGLWLVGGAIVMGTGIWAMHFTGMLALQMPMNMEFEGVLTIISVIIAILGSGCALYLLMKVERFHLLHYIVGGIIVGLAISSMHYIGMEAMKIHVNILYNPPLFFLAILIAFIASIAALWLAIESNKGTFAQKFVLKIGSALIMGIAVCGMHYTGMAAAIMTPLSTHTLAAQSSPFIFSSDNLIFYVAIVEMLIIAIIIFTSTYSQLVTIEKFKLQKEELISTKNSLDTKSSFLANMSHELRTPLNAIIGYSELMQEEAEDINAGNIVADLKKVISSAKHLLNLINDILDLSKIEAGKMELFLEDVEIFGFVEELKAIFEPLLEKHHNQFHLQIAEDIGMIRTDVTRARQCVLNLLSNSAKFTANGDITLKIERIKQSDQELIKISVTDTGIGMTEEQQTKIFQMFSQADLSTTRKFGGTGLGLYLTQRFCKMLGGIVTVTSEYGKGSTFVLTLPALCSADGKTTFEAAPLPIKTNVTKSTYPTILIIDDDPNVHNLLESHLKPFNYTILHAYNGEKGYKIAKEFKPNLVILDIIMPGVDGWALLSSFKSDPVLKNTKVILISMIPDKDLGLALGAVDYFQKPIDFDKFDHRISELLANGSLSELSSFCDLGVLIVDDDAHARQIMVRTVKKLSAIPFEAKNGQEALAFLETCECLPALILLDLMMPEMDGFTVIKHLQKNEKWRNIPVIVITAKELTYTERVALTNAAERILQKSSNTKDVMSIIEKLIHQKLVRNNISK